MSTTHVRLRTKIIAKRIEQPWFGLFGPRYTLDYEWDDPPLYGTFSIVVSEQTWVHAHVGRTATIEITVESQRSIPLLLDQASTCAAMIQRLEELERLVRIRHPGSTP